MPVLGHGFVGLATALATRRNADRPAVRGLWVPGAVALAYLPDIAAQLGIAFGWRDAGVITHSLGFAVAASAVCALVLARWAAVSLGRGFGLALFTIVAHIVMDVLQATSRALWWPLSTHRVRIDHPVIPPGRRSEALLFAGLLCLFLVVRFAFRRFRTRGRRPARGQASTEVGAPRPARFVRLGYLLTLSVFGVAGGMHMLQSVRAREYDQAVILLADRHYAEALARLAQARRWPGVGKPGRIEYERAEAYAGLGDRAMAERCYLASVRAEPGYFWAVADLAVLYASSGESSAVRRTHVAPYLERLRTDFAGHPHQPHVLAKIQRKLAQP